MADAAGFVLAGGRSSRMGRDKALLAFSGRPLVEYAIAALHQSEIPVSVVGDRPDLVSYAPVIPDQETGRGPLQGVCRALASTDSDLAILLSVDTPLVPSGLLSYMLRRARVTGALVTLPVVNGFPQTFPCVLSREVLPVLERELNGGRAGCLAAFCAAARQAGEPPSLLPLELLAQTGHVSHPAGIPPAFWLFNLNTPCDVDFGQRWNTRPIA